MSSDKSLLNPQDRIKKGCKMMPEVKGCTK